MADIFLKLLKQRLPHCNVSGNVELQHIYHPSNIPPNFEATQQMVAKTLSLEHILFVKESAGEMSSKGDFFLEMPDQNHFMVLSQRVYGAVINLGWRGNPFLDQTRREQYVNLLKKYFKK